LEAAKTATFDYDFIDNDSEELSRLEGYLFPDTYEFYEGHNAKDALNKLIRTFNSRLDDDLLAQAEAKGYDLEDIVETGDFRRDLYYRLNVVSIKVPNLKERTGDIGALVEHFLRQYNEKFQVHRTMDEDAVEYLKQCDWPGNIRELENVVQRLMISAKGERITLLDVMRELHNDIFESAAIDFGVLPDADGKVMDLEVMVNNFEKNIIRHACEKYGSTRKVAKAIGISQTQLVRKKKKYGI